MVACHNPRSLQEELQISLIPAIPYTVMPDLSGSVERMQNLYYVSPTSSLLPLVYSTTVTSCLDLMVYQSSRRHAMNQVQALAAAAFAVLVLAFYSAATPMFSVQAQGQIPAEQPSDSSSYVAPAPGAVTASAGTTIALRLGTPIDSHSVQNSSFSVTGSSSGLHDGSAILARDGMTVIFRPGTSFVPGETVTVTAQQLRTQAGDAVATAQWTFTVSPKPYPYTTELDSSNEHYLDDAEAASGAKSVPLRSASVTDVAQSYVTPNYLYFPVTNGQVADGRRR